MRRQAGGISGRFEGLDARLDLRPGRTLSDAEIVLALQVQPHLRACPKVLAQPQCGLFSAAMTAALAGIPTLVHWISTGRTRPLRVSYDRTLVYLLKWFGTIYALVAGTITLIASADLLFGAGLGYPVWSVLFGAAMVTVGLVIRWMAGLWLTRR
ncbi:MAG TPA: hypothetical protein VH913_16080 [Hyphomicrobiaceae bacterium]|jgi:hypothetical protein